MATKPEPTYWLSGYYACNLCADEYHDAKPGAVMYDAAMPRYHNSWGNICQTCFDHEDCKTGLGKGQKYVKQADGRWLCVEGLK